MSFEPINESSLLDLKHGQELRIKVHKPHAGLVQVVGVTQDDKYKVLFEWSLFAADLINQNKKGENLNDAPENWPTDHDKRAKIDSKKGR